MEKIVFSEPCLMTAGNLDLCQDIGLRATSDTAARTLWVLLIDSRNESSAVFNTLQCEIKGNWSSAHFLCHFLEISLRGWLQEVTVCVDHTRGW